MRVLHLLFLIAIIDGYSRYIVAYDLRASMQESDVEIVLQRAYEKYPKEEILKTRDEKLRKAREKRIEYYNQKSTLFGNAKVSYFR